MSNPTLDSPMTKREALASLRVGTGRPDRWLWSATDLVHCTPGRRLIALGDSIATLMIGVSGAVEVTMGDRSTMLTDGFVLDRWCVDGTAHSVVQVTAASPVDLLVVSPQWRDAVLRRLPRLRRRARNAAAMVLRPAPSDAPGVIATIDLTGGPARRAPEPGRVADPIVAAPGQRGAARN